MQNFPSWNIRYCKLCEFYDENSQWKLLTEFDDKIIYILLSISDFYYIVKVAFTKFLNNNNHSINVIKNVSSQGYHIKQFSIN